MTDPTRRPKFPPPASPPPRRRAGARSAGSPNYLVVTQDPKLGFAVERMAQSQNLSVILYWSLDSLVEKPLLDADVLVIDLDLWQQLHSTASTKVQHLLSKIPAVITSAGEHPTLAIGTGEHVHAVLPKKCSPGDILQAAVRALRKESEVSLAD